MRQYSGGLPLAESREKSGHTTVDLMFLGRSGAVFDPTTLQADQMISSARVRHGKYQAIVCWILARLEVDICGRQYSDYVKTQRCLQKEGGNC
jgi:hypothetical protein